MVPTITVEFLSSVSPEQVPPLVRDARGEVAGKMELLGRTLYTITAGENTATLLRQSGLCKLVEEDIYERIGPRT